MVAMALCCNLLVGLWSAEREREPRSASCPARRCRDCSFLLIADIDKPACGFIHGRPRRISSAWPRD